MTQQNQGIDNLSIMRAFAPLKAQQLGMDYTWKNEHVITIIPGKGIGEDIDLHSGGVVVCNRLYEIQRNYGIR